LSRFVPRFFSKHVVWLEGGGLLAASVKDAGISIMKKNEKGAGQLENPDSSVDRPEHTRLVGSRRSCCDGRM